LSPRSVRPSSQRCAPSWVPTSRPSGHGLQPGRAEHSRECPGAELEAELTRAGFACWLPPRTHPAAPPGGAPEWSRWARAPYCEWPPSLTRSEWGRPGLGLGNK
uniref:Uncharacterized protein n=1 Tax=Mustela putorius furo TaxID=9669 RepID=M3Z2D9_MUSPF